MLFLLLLFAASGCIQCSQVLVPPDINIAVDKAIHATATCGEMDDEPYREVFCQIAGSSQYTPLSQYSYNTGVESANNLRELKSTKHSFIQGGQVCDYCEANTTNEHPARFMVDGRSTWWQSPPLSRGKQYEQINITIDLGQEFHVAYVWIQMANSPRPAKWVLEKSVDYGKTYKPWQYFAESYAECQEFGQETLEPILRDDSVICTTEFSNIAPLENGEMMIKLLEKRPGRGNFSHSEVLQEFAKATNIRLRLLRTKTLHGHLINVQKRKDPSVTRRHFYAIKEIFMGGRCVCNGHASSCDVLDPKRSHMLLCRCEHNTCGDQCEKCCPGFEQKEWRRAKDGEEFHCEPCNCHGHSDTCVYEKELSEKHLSLDIYGRYEGGGRCLNCQDHTEGINCNKCVVGYYRPYGKSWSDIDACQPCQCNPRIHSDICEEETGQCHCKPQFTGPNCDHCSPGYYSPPQCLPCECSPSGTEGKVCLPQNGQCPCKPNYTGQFCDECSVGFTNKTGVCEDCNCNSYGSVGVGCSMETGQCECRINFAGLLCDRCADGYYDYPRCEYCNCDPLGAEGGLCDGKTGTCLCKPGYVGNRCDQCDSFYYGYPNCEECNCDPNGSEMSECELKTGECTCRRNFIGRRCDRCKPGYYGYPNCKACDCHVDGSEGLTCDNDGKCFCKPSFQGDKCNECKPNFYNFPLCEECRCDPSGVSKDFGGCDKAEKGKLCECKKNVEGRICNRCKPTFWGLNYQLEDGCQSCNCHPSGTVEGLNVCDLVTGQCQCKEYAAGRDCSICAEGYYNLQQHNIFGCQPCNCNKGGSIGIGCDIHTGQCYCRPRVTGLKCDQPIADHYIPTLWHNKYEAEDGRTIDGDSVRYASDAEKFTNFSSKGFAVFSETQDEILLSLNIHKSTLYQILFVYVNPTPVDAEVDVTVVPSFSSSQSSAFSDAEQTVSDILPSSNRPAVRSVNKRLPFALNPGVWTLHIKVPKRVFLDYVTLLPSEYYEADLLKDVLVEPCKSNDDNKNCIKTSYPPLPYSSRACISSYQNDIKDQYDSAEKVCNKAVDVDATVEEKEVQVKLTVPEDGDYFLVLEYNNSAPVVIHTEIAIERLPDSTQIVNATAEYCPYGIYCRSLAVHNGEPASFYFKKDSDVDVKIKVPAKNKLSLTSANLIKARDWDLNILNQASVCTMKNGECIEQTYPLAVNELVREAKAGPNSAKAIEISHLPFSVAAPLNTKVLLLDEQEKSINIESSVSGPGKYVFIVHYYNLDNGLVKIPVYLNTDTFYDCVLNVEYCPNKAGCRAVIQDIKRNYLPNFDVSDKFEATLNYNSSQKGPVYINSIIAIPVQSYSDSLLKLQPVDASEKFIRECGDDEFKNAPSNVSQFCRDNVFALTTDFNSASFPCYCSHEGSKSFSCEKYGGQCLCRPNIIGRQCDQCEPGYYDFPYCRKCNCLIGQTCNQHTGQCYCPRYVEGQMCDRCVQYAYGYDPLIGCQLCQCHPEGLDNEYGSAQCDSNNGQCLCKTNVGGRRCDQCLSGYYGFPHCYRCACDQKGTTDNICDSQTSECICKENVEGSSCDRCKPGMFNLEESNSLGCSECFCFGATDRCVSSSVSVGYVYFDREAWEVTDTKAVMKNDGQVYYSATPDEIPVVSYYKVPITPGSDFTSSYGLTISYRIVSLPNTGSEVMSVAPDLKLVGNNKTLEYWIRDPPTNLDEPYTIQLKLIPENFIFDNGAPVKRSDLMLVLVQLDEILVKGSYYESTNHSSLTDFLMETGKSSVNGDGVLIATSVEICECPTSYTGNSCQYCADGYYRVKTGAYLGACVACDCNGHSGYCDKETGVCVDCQDHTHGDHCELCEVGYYGDATRGIYGCLPCQCPSIYNNFAVSCQVDNHGNLESCTCQEGVNFLKFRCGNGYFGEPSVYGGHCTKCSCNNNNDLTLDGSCNPADGQCDNCLNHTAGDHCELCEEWYFGDAIEAKNCTDCGCNRSGSQYCDKDSGKCLCKPNVESETCDRCVDNAWGLNRGIGCDMCNCGEASQGEQCDNETGQCACMPGAAGMRCETCDHGYWNYTSDGCTKCDCEADLSLGTVCDIKTGNCHCQKGATGPRCDQCLISYLRIPDYGCRMCDECVLSLVGELDVVDAQQGALDYAVKNMSPATLAGARLTRLSKNIETNRELLDGIVSLTKSGSLDSVKGLVDTQKEAALVTAARARDLHESAVEGHKTLEKFMSGLKKLQEELKNRIEASYWPLKKFDELSLALSSRKVPLDFDEIEKLASRTLEKMKEPYLWQLKDSEVDIMAKQIDDYKNKLEVMIEETKQGGDNLRQKINDSKAVLDGMLSKASDLQSIAEDYKRFLDDVVKMVKKANQMVEKIEEKKLNMVDVSSKAVSISLQIRSLLDDAAILSDRVNNYIQTANASLAKINELTEKLNAHNISTARTHRYRREPLDVRHDVQDHVNHLVEQAKNLSQLFSGAKSEATNALEAANIYNDLKESFRSIQSLVDNAIDDSKLAKEVAKDQPYLASKAKDKSIGIEDEVKSMKKNYDDAVESDFSSKENLQMQKQFLNESKKRLEQQKNNPLNTTAVGSLNECEKYLDVVDDKISSVEAKVTKINDFIKSSDGEVKSTLTNNKNLHTTVDDVRKGYTRIKDTTDAIKSLIDSNNESLTADRKLSQFKKSLQGLKEQLSRARDLVQRVHLTVSFGKNSNLEIPLPESLGKSSSTVKAECYIKTSSGNGLILFYGDEDDGNESDYVTLTLKDGMPYLTVGLGDKPSVISLDKKVNDDDWWKITGERTGRKLIITAQKAGTLKSFQKSEDLGGKRRLLDVHNGKGKLFVGGIPDQVKVNLPEPLSSFEGEIDSLFINNAYIPLWNMDKGSSSNVLGRRVRPLDEAETLSGLTFIGDSYAIMNLPGGGTPHKTNAFSIRFQTYDPNGLLYYSGRPNDMEFMSLRMVNGIIQLKFNLGSGELKLSLSNKTYNDGRWHTVDVNRRGRRVRLTVDKEFVDAESGGDSVDLNTDTVYYIGGLPPQFEKKESIPPFRGCVKEVKLNSHFVDLNKPNATKNVKQGCSYSFASTVSFSLDESRSSFANIDLGNISEIMFHFKTEQQIGHLITIRNSKENVGLEFELDDGVLTVASIGRQKIGSKPLSDGRWHFVAIKKAGDQVDVEVDDNLLGNVPVSDKLFKSDSNGKIHFGQKDDGSLSFYGCISDVILDGIILDFKQAQNDRIRFFGCDASKFLATSEPKAVESNAYETTTVPATTVTSTTTEPVVQHDLTACALSSTPLLNTDDNRGQRFGLASDSRLEYNTLSTSFDMKSIFTVQIRPSGLHGLIMLSKDRRNVDYISLYMVNGSVNFAFNAGHGAVILRSKRYLLDGKWHDVIAERYQRNGTLYVDGNMEDNGLSPVGSVSINSEPPLYIGGLPKDINLLSSITKVLPGLKPTFVGCMRNFTLNGVKLDNPEKYNLAPCSEGVEKGTYFGGKDGYVILHRNFSIDPAFTVELEIRARTKTAVLLSANGVDSFTIQLINGTAYFSVTNNGKTTTVSSTLTSSNDLCDGHWHSIKAFKSKNVLMLTVDSKNTLGLMSDVSRNGMTINAPLYLGGVPKGTNFKSLNTTESYVGCIRYGFKKRTKRMKKDLEFSDIEVFGDVNTSSCLAN